MHHLIAAARSAVSQQNWYAALTIALTFPDMCGSIEDPTRRSTARSVDWFNAVMAPRYTRNMPGNVIHTFLSGEDCYALRCAFLHEASLDITNQRVQDALDGFVFITPPPNHNLMHMNQSGRRLQLQVDMFVEEMCSGVESWIASITANAAMRSRLDGLSRIYDPVRRAAV